MNNVDLVSNTCHNHQEDPENGNNDQDVAEERRRSHCPAKQQDDRETHGDVVERVVIRIHKRLERGEHRVEENNPQENESDQHGLDRRRSERADREDNHQLAQQKSDLVTVQIGLELGREKRVLGKEGHRVERSVFSSQEEPHPERD